MIIIDDIESICGGQNAKGVKPYIYISHDKNIDSTPAPDADTLNVSTPIVPVTNEGFVRWGTSIVLSKNSWKVETEGDPDSVSYKTTFAVFIGGVSSTKTNYMRTLPGCGQRVITEDKNGNLRIVGDDGDGCSVKWVEDINGDTNGYTLTFEWISGHPPYFYTAAIPLKV